VDIKILTSSEIEYVLRRICVKNSVKLHVYCAAAQRLQLHYNIKVIDYVSDFDEIIILNNQ